MWGKFKMIHIVLCQPEIPQNTGNIMRTCVGTNVEIHLIKPLGFKIDDKKLRRSAVDYYDSLKFNIHDNWDDFISKYQGKFYFLTRYGKNVYSDIKYNEIKEDTFLVFGSESYGIDRKLLASNENNTLRIPINDKIRSLNLSNSVAIVLFEVLRQQNFNNLSKLEPVTLKGPNYLDEFKE